MTFISTKGTPGPSSVLGQLYFDTISGSPPPCGTKVLNGKTIPVCHATAATAGIEQPIFDGENFWVAIGATSLNPNGEIAEIDPKTFQRIGAIPMTTCSGPSGLTFVPPHGAAAACGGVQFLDLSTKTVVGTPVAETGGADQIWYNRGDGNVYAPDSNASIGCASSDTALVGPPTGPSVTGAQLNSCVAVVRASDRSVIAEVQLPVYAGSHSVAADSHNNKVFVPVRDTTCSPSPAKSCVPTLPVAPSITPCPLAIEDGGCAHDQGIAVIQLGP